MNAAVGNVRNMFMRMKPGDLVVMAGRSIYGEIYAGEIATAFDPNDTLDDVYERESIPYRRVSWIKGLAERRFLSENLSHLLSNRKTVIAIDKDVFGDELYPVVYGDYVFGDDSRYVFDGPAYKNFPILGRKRWRKSIGLGTKLVA